MEKHTAADVADAIVGVTMVPLGLLGLLMASRALDLEMSVFGYSLAFFAASFGFGVLKGFYDRADRPALAIVPVPHA